MKPLNKTPQQKAQEVLTFFKEAMCVDGEVRFATDAENDEQNIKPRHWIRFEDSKRGIFYLATSGKSS
ncbi:MAG: hypothetical protein V1920_06935 [Bacillota bacterium]